MDPEEIDRWRALLIARRDALIATGDEDITPNRLSPVEHVDEDAQPLNEMNQVIASRRNRERVQELQLIQGALARLELDPDAFGECQDCGDDIPQGRLEFMPWAVTCVACQERRAPRLSNNRRRHALDFME